MRDEAAADSVVSSQVKYGLSRTGKKMELDAFS
jgi:hypothetical protein